MTPDLARRLWRYFEPIHGAVYFTAEARAAADAAGYRGYWMSYFAFRMAPLGPVGPDEATALCYGFHPSRARRALPDAWDLAPPATALAARASGAAAALRHILAGANCHLDGVSAAVDGLVARGWTTDAGLLTDAGRAVRADVEARTDAAAASPWQRVGADAARRLGDLLAPLAQAVVDHGGFPLPNPVGLPPPAHR